jgi:type III secretion protein V
VSLASYFRSAASADHRSGGLARYTDIALVAGIVAIIALMIVPLPTWVLDTLVAVNISGGVLLLLLAIYVANPLEFSVFPSVLLISTLFRLSLSIATTRMILCMVRRGTSSTRSATWWRAATWWWVWWCS